MTSASSDLAQGPPPISAALVEYLERVWPDRFPVVVGSDPVAVGFELQRIRGCREVVSFLREHLDRQTRQGQARATKTSPF